MPNVIVSRVNARGIPCLKTTNATAHATRLTLTVAPYQNLSDFFQGLFLVYVTSIPAGVADDLPVYLSTEGYLGSEKQLFTPQSTAVTSQEVVEGVYLCFYDSTTGKVRVMM